MKNQNDDLDDQLYILLASMKEYREAIADDKKRLETFYSQVASGVLDKAEKSLQDTNKQAIGALKAVFRNWIRQQADWITVLWLSMPVPL